MSDLERLHVGVAKEAHPQRAGGLRALVLDIHEAERVGALLDIADLVVEGRAIVDVHPQEGVVARRAVDAGGEEAGEQAQHALEYREDDEHAEPGD